MSLAEQKEALAYLATLQSGVVTDALVRLGLEGWMDYVLPMEPGGRLAGPAVTVKYAPRRGIGASKENLYSIIRRCKPGDVLVIEALGTDCWILGENVAHAAFYQELAGIVLDGRVRDAAEIREMELPVFAGAPPSDPTPLHGAGRLQRSHQLCWAPGAPRGTSSSATPMGSLVVPASNSPR